MNKTEKQKQKQNIAATGIKIVACKHVKKVAHESKIICKNCKQEVSAR